MIRQRVHLTDLTDSEIAAEAQRRDAAGEHDHAAELRQFADIRRRALADGVPLRAIRRAVDNMLQARA